MTRILNFIGNQFLEPASGQWLTCVNPATGQTWGEVANSDHRDAEAALISATDAQTQWQARSSDERSALLYRLADLIETHAEALAELETQDTGKPLSVSRSIDIPRVSANFRFFAAAGTQFSSESHLDAGQINYTVRQPLGVVTCISPWNLPLYLLSWKIAPAVAAGNTVVAKPSEVTPATADYLARLIIEAGFPPGVINIVHGQGDRIGAPLVSSPLCKAVSFTGSTRIGGWIAEQCAPAFRKLSLEMGGKNPAIVCADADPTTLIDDLIRASFANQGQICLCASRILIARQRYDEIRDQLVERVSQMQPGDPLLAETQQGALVSEAHMNAVLESIQQAREDGGRILCGGDRVRPSGRCENGFFVQPTLIEGLPMDSRTNQKEIFGPVVTLTPFDDEPQAIALANQSAYGLAATVWTRDLDRAHRMAHQLQTGIVWINCWLRRDLRTPFGGMKASGMGREGGLEAMRFFTEPKNICLEPGGC